MIMTKWILILTVLVCLPLYSMSADPPRDEDEANVVTSNVQPYCYIWFGNGEEPLNYHLTAWGTKTIDLLVDPSPHGTGSDSKVETISFGANFRFKINAILSWSQPTAPGDWNVLLDNNLAVVDDDPIGGLAGSIGPLIGPTGKPVRRWDVSPRDETSFLPGDYIDKVTLTISNIDTHTPADTYTGGELWISIFSAGM